VIKLLRAIACLFVAIAVASVSLAASAHAGIVIVEPGYHTEIVASEMPCADCGSHRLRVCGQSCFASLEAVEAEIPALNLSVSRIGLARRDSLPAGMQPIPLLGPPIV